MMNMPQAQPHKSCTVPIRFLLVAFSQDASGRVKPPRNKCSVLSSSRRPSWPPPSRPWQCRSIRRRYAAQSTSTAGQHDPSCHHVNFAKMLEQDDNVHATTSSANALSTTSSGDRATDHTIEYDTWVGYNSTWKYFKVRWHVPMHLYTGTLIRSLSLSRHALQMWADEAGQSFTIEEAKIKGRKISYPCLLDQKGEPLLESTLQKNWPSN